MKFLRFMKNLEVVKKKEEFLSVVYYKFYFFVDIYDVLFIFFGIVGVCMYGVVIFVFFIFFGKFIDVFGMYYNDFEIMSKEVFKVYILFWFLSFFRKRIGFIVVCELLLNNF